MKETIKSLKYVLIIFGIFSLLKIGGVTFIITYPIVGIFSLVNVLFGIIMIYMGIKLNEFISEKKKFIINFLYLDMILIILYDLYILLTGGGNGITAFDIIITIIVNLYLIKNINRLSQNKIINQTIKK